MWGLLAYSARLGKFAAVLCRQNCPTTGWWGEILSLAFFPPVREQFDFQQPVPHFKDTMEIWKAWRFSRNSPRGNQKSLVEHCEARPMVVGQFLVFKWEKETFFVEDKWGSSAREINYSVF